MNQAKTESELRSVLRRLLRMRWNKFTKGIILDTFARRLKEIRGADGDQG